MKQGTWHRGFWRTALCAVALACGPGALAQDAEPAAPPPALPGVADIDFSLRGKQIENPGTPTEGRTLRQANPPAPASSQAPSTAASPAARAAPSPTTAARPDAPARQLQAEPPRAAQAGPSPSPIETATTDDTPASGTAPEALPATGSADEAVAAPATEETGGSNGLLALGFGLVLLGAAVWFAMRRSTRRTAQPDTFEHGADEAQVPEPVTPTLPPATVRAPSPPATLPAAQSTPPSREPVAEPAPERPFEGHPALRVRIPDPVPPPDAPREGHPALRVKIPEPFVASPPPAPQPAPGLLRFDAFGRPIAPVAAPRPAPPPPPPRKRIVRYDALGMPIRD